MRGMSPEADVGVGIVRVECVSPLEPDSGPAEGVLWFAVELLKECRVGRGLMNESREPSRLSALGAGGAKYDFRLCLFIMETAHSSMSTGVRLAA